MRYRRRRSFRRSFRSRRGRVVRRGRGRRRRLRLRIGYRM